MSEVWLDCCGDAAHGSRSASVRIVPHSSAACPQWAAHVRPCCLAPQSCKLPHLAHAARLTIVPHTANTATKTARADLSTSADRTSVAREKAGNHGARLCCIHVRGDDRPAEVNLRGPIDALHPSETPPTAEVSSAPLACRTLPVLSFLASLALFSLSLSLSLCARSLFASPPHSLLCLFGGSLRASLGK